MTKISQLSVQYWVRIFIHVSQLFIFIHSFNSATFPALHPPESTPFSVYSKSKSSAKDDEKEFASKNLFTVGETPVVDFYSTKEGVDVAQGCRSVIYSQPALVF